jgi:hypothetical protein
MNADGRRKGFRMHESFTPAAVADRVREVLLRKGDFDDATPMIETPIRRREAVVGTEFTLLAPRSVRLSAIWSAEDGKIHFYDSEASRFQTVEVGGVNL